MEIKINKTKTFYVTYYLNTVRLKDMQKEVMSSTYSEQWQLTDLFCPNCGCKSAWKRTDNGKIYLNRNFICTCCEGEFSLPEEAVFKIGRDDKTGQHRLAGLK